MKDSEDKMRLARNVCVFSSLDLVGFHFCIFTQAPLLTKTKGNSPEKGFRIYGPKFNQVINRHNSTQEVNAGKPVRWMVEKESDLKKKKKKKNRT